MPSGQTTLKLTYEDYKHFPDDGRRHEIIDGDHLVTPAPSTDHQGVLTRLLYQLAHQIELTGRGRVFAAPIDLQLSETDIVQPDLVVVAHENRQIITPSKLRGVPDLVIEILSASTSSIDRGLKRDLYARAGIPEYWIVDLEERRVERHQLESGRYQLESTLGDSLTCSVFPDLAIDLHQLW